MSGNALSHCTLSRSFGRGECSKPAGQEDRKAMQRNPKGAKVRSLSSRGEASTGTVTVGGPRDCIPGHSGHPYRCIEGWDDVSPSSDAAHSNARLLTEGPTPRILRPEASMFIRRYQKAAARASGISICLQRAVRFPRRSLRALGLSGRPLVTANRCTPPRRPP